MSNFDRILIPINGNESAMDFAIDTAKNAGAKLYLLTTYRLTDHNPDMKIVDNKSIRQTLEEEMRNKVESAYNEKLSTSGVPFEILVEIGFLSDRIIANIDELDIDVLVMDNMSFDSDDVIGERFHELKIPVLFKSAS
ncbi:MAG: universal stress protein [Cyclobacteriaceae bacterium]